MRVLIYIYVFAAAILSFGSLLMQSYPARFWIDIFAPEPGDKYPVSITGLLTFLCLLLPLVFVMFILKLKRNRKKIVTDSNTILDDTPFNRNGIHFTRMKQLQSRLIASPVFINGEQKGRIDSGKTLFIELLPGTYEVEIGNRTEKSDKLIVQIEPNVDARVVIEIVPNGIRSKYIVRNV